MNNNRPADAIDCSPAAQPAGDADESSRSPDARCGCGAENPGWEFMLCTGDIEYVCDECYSRIFKI